MPTPMPTWVRRGPSASFLFALFCFVLPFVTLSCPGQSRSFSGLQLATGTSIEQPQLFGDPVKKKVDAEPFATLALLCAGAGLLVSLGASRARRVAALAAAGLGALALLVLRSRLGARVVEESQGLFQLSYSAGYGLALLAFGLAALFAVLLVLNSLEAGSPQADRLPAGTGSSQT